VGLGGNRNGKTPCTDVQHIRDWPAFDVQNLLLTLTKIGRTCRIIVERTRSAAATVVLFLYWSTKQYGRSSNSQTLLACSDDILQL
jgi:hypothetical protein